jgi:transcriptional regulator with XRE-family HTH domain
MPRKVREARLTNDVLDQLKELGGHLAAARLRRRLSASELARRVGVDRRTIAQLEAGSATVALGTFLQTLDVLGLLRGLDEVVRADNDIEAIGAEVRRARQRRRRAPKIPDAKVDF